MLWEHPVHGQMAKNGALSKNHVLSQAARAEGGWMKGTVTTGPEGPFHLTCCTGVLGAKVLPDQNSWQRARRYLALLCLMLSLDLTQGVPGTEPRGSALTVVKTQSMSCIP